MRIATWNINSVRHRIGLVSRFLRDHQPDVLALQETKVENDRFPGETLKKLFSPTLEKALTFLDDKLLPSTSNAVERGNRRYRKMQKSVYRVRTQAQIRARLALDMWREAHAEGRQQTLTALHRARAG